MSNPKCISQLLPVARKAISAFATKVDRYRDGSLNIDDSACSRTESLEGLEKALHTARALLDDLQSLDTKFKDNLVVYGAPRPLKNQDGHIYNVRQRCYGDGDTLENCGRWFVKVSLNFPR